MTDARRGRRPDPAVDAAIGDAVLDLFVDRGFELTFDEVAGRAGVGRATVFRRFDTKRDMILGAMSRASIERVRVPDTGSLRGDLLALVGDLMAVFGEPRTRAVAGHFLGAAYRDPAFTDLLRINLDRRLGLVDTVLTRGADRGELSPSPSPERTTLLADLLSGLIGIRLATDTPLPGEAETETLVDGLLHGFA